MRGAVGMIIVRHEKYGWLLPSVWFAEEPLHLRRSALGLWLRALPVPAEKLIPRSYTVVYQTVQRTLVTPLSESEDELFARLNATTRNNVRRATEFLSSNRDWRHVSPEAISREQASLVETFLDSKGLDPWVASHGILRTPIAPHLLASSLERDGTPMIVHVYVVDREAGTAWLYWSASGGFTAEERDLQGRLNRWLHWQDILWFKNARFEQYDWGGAGETPEVISITRFKQSFGGDSFVRYHALVCHRMIARFVRVLRQLKFSRRAR